MACSLNVGISITGDCSNTNSGVFSVDIYGTAPDYSIQWINPALGTIALGSGVTGYTATTLSDQGVYANTGNVRIYTGEASLTGQPSGTTIRTKIETANNKNVEIHAYTTQWRSSV